MKKTRWQAPENSTCQGVGSGDTLHIDGAQKLLNQSQASVTTGPSMSGNDTGSSANEKCSVGPSISGSETRSSANQEGTASSPVNEIKLPPSQESRLSKQAGAAKQVKTTERTR
ncbi:hypothetical protein MRX96_047908 [Rhipicephalus microplus]